MLVVNNPYVGVEAERGVGANRSRSSERPGQGSKATGSASAAFSHPSLRLLSTVGG